MWAFHIFAGTRCQQEIQFILCCTLLKQFFMNKEPCSKPVSKAKVRNSLMYRATLFCNNQYMCITPPMLSQHSRSQALVKEEGCDRRGEPTLNLAILMEMKPERKPLGRNPLSDAPYRNLGMVLNRQGPGRHPLVTCHVVI